MWHCTYQNHFVPSVLCGRKWNFKVLPWKTNIWIVNLCINRPKHCNSTYRDLRWRTRQDAISWIGFWRKKHHFKYIVFDLKLKYTKTRIRQNLSIGFLLSKHYSSVVVVLSGRKRSVSALFKWSEKAPPGCAPDLRRDTRNVQDFF